MKRVRIRPFRYIGTTETACPSCGVVLVKRPQRLTKCRHCGEGIYARTRPIDGAKVLLKQSDLAALEEDWAVDYEIKSRQPREVDPVWAARIEQARQAGPAADPSVEREAQRIFAEMLRAETAPRDVVDTELQRLPAEQRDAVGLRVWQFQVQWM